MALTTHPYLWPRLKQRYNYTSTPTLDIHGLFYDNIYLLFIYFLLFCFLFNSFPYIFSCLFTVHFFSSVDPLPCLQFRHQHVHRYVIYRKNSSKRNSLTTSAHNFFPSAGYVGIWVCGGVAPHILNKGQIWSNGICTRCEGNIILVFMGPYILLIFWYIIPTRCTSHRVYLIW